MCWSRRGEGGLVWGTFVRVWAKGRFFRPRHPSTGLWHRLLSFRSPPPPSKRVALAWVPPGLLRSPLKSNAPVLRHTPMDDDWLSGATAIQISWQQWQQWQRLVPRHPALPRAAANTVGCIGRLIARRARPARGKPQRQTTASAPSCSFTPQRRPTTCPTTPRTTDAAAVTAPDTLANPINVAYRRRLGLIPTIPPFASSPC